MGTGLGVGVGAGVVSAVVSDSEEVGRVDSVVCLMSGNSSATSEQLLNVILKTSSTINRSFVLRSRGLLPAE